MSKAGRGSFELGFLGCLVLLFAVMSALEIIEQIKALPPKEQADVVDFVRKMESSQPGKTVRYMTDEDAQAAGNKVLAQYKEVFKKLAQ
jgi:hypothetical protein